jgi:hypothetical protein
LARRRSGENVEADAGGEDGEGYGVTDHCLHKLISCWFNRFLREPAAPGNGNTRQLGKSFRKVLVRH